MVLPLCAHDLVDVSDGLGGNGGGNLFGSDGISDGVVFGREGRGIKVLQGSFGGVEVEGLDFLRAGGYSNGNELNFLDGRIVKP